MALAQFLQLSTLSATKVSAETPNDTFQMHHSLKKNQRILPKGELKCKAKQKNVMQAKNTKVNLC